MPPLQRRHVSARTLVLWWCCSRVAEAPGEAPDGCSASHKHMQPPTLPFPFPAQTNSHIYSTQQKGAHPRAGMSGTGPSALKSRASNPKCIRSDLQKTSDDPSACIIYHPAVGNQRGRTDERHRCLLAFMLNFVPFLVSTSHIRNCTLSVKKAWHFPCIMFLFLCRGDSSMRLCPHLGFIAPVKSCFSQTYWLLPSVWAVTQTFCSVGASHRPRLHFRKAAAAAVMSGTMTHAVPPECCCASHSFTLSALVFCPFSAL